MKELTREEMLEIVGGHVRYEHLHNTVKTHSAHAGAHYHEPSSHETKQEQD